MAYVYDVVTLNSIDYPVYASLEAADAYLEGSMSENAQKWRLITDEDTKKRYIIQMTRLIDRQRWKGEKTDEAQELQFPRTGTGVDGVEDNQIPQAIVDATIEGAASLANGGDFETTQNQSQKIQSMSAGRVSMSFFRGAEGTASRFPLNIQELLRDLLAGSSPALTGVASGVDSTDAESVTSRDWGVNRGI